MDGVSTMYISQQTTRGMVFKNRDGKSAITITSGGILSGSDNFFDHNGKQVAALKFVDSAPGFYLQISALEDGPSTGKLLFNWNNIDRPEIRLFNSEGRLTARLYFVEKGVLAVEDSNKQKVAEVDVIGDSKAMQSFSQLGTSMLDYKITVTNTSALSELALIEIVSAHYRFMSRR